MVFGHYPPHYHPYDGTRRPRVGFSKHFASPFGYPPFPPHPYFDAPFWHGSSQFPTPRPATCTAPPKDEYERMKIRMDRLEMEYQQNLEYLKKRLAENEYESTRLEIEREDLLAEQDLLNRGHEERQEAWARFSELHGKPVETHELKKSNLQNDHEEFIKDLAQPKAETTAEVNETNENNKISENRQENLKQHVNKESATKRKLETKVQTFRPVAVCGPNGCVYQILVPDIDANEVCLTIKTPDFIKEMLEKAEEVKKSRASAELKRQIDETPKKVRPVVVLGPDGSVYQIMVPDIDPSDLALTVKHPTVLEQEENKQHELELEKQKQKQELKAKQEARKDEATKHAKEKYEGHTTKLGGNLKFRTVVVCGPDGTLCHALVPDIDPNDMILTKTTGQWPFIEVLNDESKSEEDKKPASKEERKKQTFRNVMFRGPDGLLYRILVPDETPQNSTEETTTVVVDDATEKTANKAKKSCDKPRVNDIKVDGMSVFDLLSAMFSSAAGSTCQSSAAQTTKKHKKKGAVKVVFKEDGTYESHESDEEGVVSVTADNDGAKTGNVKVTFHHDGTYETVAASSSATPASSSDENKQEESQEANDDLASAKPQKENKHLKVTTDKDGVVVETVDNESDDEGEGDEDGSWEQPCHPKHDVASVNTNTPPGSPVSQKMVDYDEGEKKDKESWMEPV